MAAVGVKGLTTRDASRIYESKRSAFRRRRRSDDDRTDDGRLTGARLGSTRVTPGRKSASYTSR